MAITSSAAGAYAAAQRLMSSGGGQGSATGTGSVAGLGGDFSSMLEKAIGGVTDSGRKAESQAMAAASGQGNLVDVVTAVAESETALQTLVAVRDRVISAYEEILRMPI